METRHTDTDHGRTPRPMEARHTDTDHGRTTPTDGDTAHRHRPRTDNPDRWRQGTPTPTTAGHPDRGSHGT
ncbi:MAG: hypothetical protein K5885_06780, partial [Bacteroidales bacterium]|nr:hypothetical protein [Bacteroidales bacterium]